MPRILRYLAVALLLGSLLLSSAAAAAGRSDCLKCHGDERLVVLRDGEKVSLYVDPAAYEASAHGQFPCTSCHQKVTAYPHGEVEPLDDVAVCTSCHSDYVKESYEYSFHGTARRLGWDEVPGCVDCHGTHDILGPEDPASRVSEENVPETCARCHGNPHPNFARGTEHVTPQDRDRAFSLWVVWKFFMALIVFDTLKDGPIVILELVRRLRVALGRRRG